MEHRKEEVTGVVQPSASSDDIVSPSKYVIVSNKDDRRRDIADLEELVTMVNHNGSNNDDENDEKYYNHLVESIKTKTGLDIGYKFCWPIEKGSTHRNSLQTTTLVDDTEYITLELSTCLPQDCIAPMFSGTQWAGTCIWRAAVVALQYILYQQNQFPDRQYPATALQLDATTTVLELGCGLGVPGMILHALTGCSTVLTDKDELVTQLRQNIATNFKGTSSIPNDAANANTVSRIEAHSLDWSMEGVQEFLNRTGIKSIDVILNCDCIYEPLYGESWRALLGVQNELLRLFPQAYVLTSCERRRADGIEQYLTAAVNLYEYISHVERLILPFQHVPVIELYRLHGHGPTIQGNADGVGQL
jgi:hypothetical protein